jgi:N-acetylglucosaminyl-diphospho-decaprenol L-rhamnosyltransferase
VPRALRAAVVIPTLNARELLHAALESLRAQTLPAEIVVVDNASTDGTGDMLRREFPEVHVVHNERNLGFGRAVNRGADTLDGDVLVLVNNDVVCEPTFLERLCTPFADERVGMAAGVLLQATRPELVDAAGLELDVTLRAWQYRWNEPAERLRDAPNPVGPSGGAGAYRLDAFRAVGGFDEELFAYWEDVDLALRLREAGWRCVLVPEARALHRHGATLGAASPAQRRLEAFGRGYVLSKYRVARGLRRRLAIALLDWPVLLVHLVVRRELGPIRARLRGAAAGRRQPPRRPPLHLATISFRASLARQLAIVRLRARGGLPEYLTERA